MLSHILRELNEANALVEPEVARSVLLVRNSTLEVFLFWGWRGAQNCRTPYLVFFLHICILSSFQYVSQLILKSSITLLRGVLLILSFVRTLISVLYMHMGNFVLFHFS